MAKSLPPAPGVRVGNLALRQFRHPQGDSPALVCLPAAGGQALAFRELAAALPPAWGIAALDLPGHGCAGGQPLGDVAAMASACRNALPLPPGRRLVLVGHSLGGCVALQWAAGLSPSERASLAVVLCGTRPSSRHAYHPTFAGMNSGTLLDYLITAGSISAIWRNEPEMFAWFEPLIRSDLAAFEAAREPRLPAGLPLLVLGGRADPVCTPDDLRAWKDIYPGCQIELTQGDHAFPQTCAAEVAAILHRWTLISAQSSKFNAVNADP